MNNLFSWLFLFFFLLVAAIFACSGCVEDNRNKKGQEVGPMQTDQDSSAHFLYDLSVPVKIYRLPHILDEVSGISVIDSNTLACIQDEAGTVFIYDLTSEKITERIHFGKPGDYEDLAVIDSVIYVLKSSGYIFRIDGYKRTNPEVVTYNTLLKSANDCEGLAYDPTIGSLLIACKGSPSVSEDKSYEGSRAIYRFPIDRNDITEEPYILLDIQSIRDFSTLDRYEQLSYKLAGTLDPNGNIAFQPSGIAVSPLNDHYFIMANRGKLILELDREWKIISMGNIDSDLLPQPEGICFDASGKLFISSEASDQAALIAVFDFHYGR
jgi:uncharacterized protein YjiK